eukprot:82450-Chlamydomonas_euryale.AAC.1
MNTLASHSRLSAHCGGRRSTGCRADARSKDRDAQSSCIRKQAARGCRAADLSGQHWAVRLQISAGNTRMSRHAGARMRCSVLPKDCNRKGALHAAGRSASRQGLPVAAIPVITIRARTHEWMSARTMDRWPSPRARSVAAGCGGILTTCRAPAAPWPMEAIGTLTDAERLRRECSAPLPLCCAAGGFCSAPLSEVATARRRAGAAGWACRPCVVGMCTRQAFLSATV